MKDTIYLEWTFSPDDYFKEEIIITEDDYRLEISKGIIKATMSPEYYYSREDTCVQLHESLESRFMGVQV